MSSPSKTRVSLSSVAARAGASLATVSRVVNGTADVSPELHARVQAAITELGYKTSRGPVARTAETETIGFLTDMDTSSMLQDDFQHRFLAGIESAVNANKGHLMFASCQEDHLANRIPSMIEQGLVSGIILKCASTTSLEWIKRLSQLLPLTLLMHSPRDHSLNSVMCDNSGGMYQTLRYLSELGHRKIGFLSVRDFENSQERANLHNEQRLQAFREYAADFGLEIGPKTIQAVTRDWSRQVSLADTMSHALDQWQSSKKQCPTAVICAADTYASALLIEAEKRGLQVPGDLSVTGFMNTLECEHLRPALTSVSLSGEEMGRTAVELISRQLKFPNAPARQILVASRLIERLSCSKV